MKHHIEEWALVLVIKDENAKIVDEFCERNPGRFSFWDENTMERAKQKVEQLNNLKS